MKLLVVSHTPHYLREESYVGWGPTVREIDHLATLFEELVHLAPVHPGTPPASSLGYQAGNVRVRAVRPAGGDSVGAKVGILSRIPEWTRAIREEMRSADVIHIRCPANISLIALLLLFVSRKPEPRWVKYAGNWRPAGAEPLSYGLQRALLRRSSHGGVVTVNGEWPDQPAHVVAFHNPCLTESELQNGRQAAVHKALGSPISIVHIGALIEGKGADVAIHVIRLLLDQGLETRLDVVGDGPLRPILEQMADRLDIADRVEFRGFVPRGEVAELLQKAHFLLHPSRSEGFPKVVAEGMAYGAVPIAGAVSSIPQVLDHTGAGVAVDPEDEEQFAEAVLEFVRDESAWAAAARNGLSSASMFGYGTYLNSVVETLGTRFGDLSGAFELEEGPQP